MVFINEIPSTTTPLEIILEVPLEGEYLEKFKETDEALAFDTDTPTLLTRSYEFFVFGFNTAAEHFHEPRSKITVKRLRELIVTRVDKRAVALSDFITSWETRENVSLQADTQIISQLTFKKLLVGSFQVGFMAQRL